MHIGVVKCNRMIWEGHLAHRGGKRNTCGVLVGRPVRNETLGKQWRKCEDNIKMDLKVMGWDGVEWNNPDYFWEMWRPPVPKALLFHKIWEFFFYLSEVL